MNIAILDGNIISNVIVVTDETDPVDFGGVELPEGMWIGDKVGPDPEPEPEPEEPVTWSALASAIREGVNAV